MKSTKLLILFAIGQIPFSIDKCGNEMYNLQDKTKAIQKTVQLGISTGSGGTIVFNPNSSSSGFNTAGTTERPAYIGLAHELFHGRDANNGVSFPSNDFNSYKSESNGLLKGEWRATFYENTVRGQLGIPLRTSYGTSNDGEGNSSPTGPSLLDSSKKPINYPIK